MISASPPAAPLTSVSATATKRGNARDHCFTKPRPRANAPFVDDADESDQDDDDPGPEPLPKRRMMERAADFAGETGSTEGRGHASLGNGPGCDRTDLIAASQRASKPTIPGLLWSGQAPLFSDSFLGTSSPPRYTVKSCNGRSTTISERKQTATVSYECMIAARSKIKDGRAKRSYYGIEIHELVNAALKDKGGPQENHALASNVPIQPTMKYAATDKKPARSLLWTEKYRARNFMDLCGDDLTNRRVLRWLKRWDPVVFPMAARSRAKIAKRPGMKQESEEEKPHKKILMLAGPPGLGKTTLAHVCALQAGYEVMEINASDERSREVVKTRIRTSLGTESVKSVTNRRDKKGLRPNKLAKPACVVVDEVDGVVSGSGGSGEGGFVKALLDLLSLDQQNSADAPTRAGRHAKKKKGDDFRQMRPLILICNDLYHPSLRPLRQSNVCEVIHVGRPSVDAVVGRLQYVFEKEGIPCEKDAARKLCEAAWGMSSGIDAKRGAVSTVEGDLRGVMVVGEWVAGRFKAALNTEQRLSRQWVERNILNDLASSATGARGLGRGSVKDVVNRIFQEGGGFPKQAMNLSQARNQREQPMTELGFGEHQKKYVFSWLAQMVDSSGESSQIMTEVFSEYPNREFNDDCYLSKPNQAYDWLHFHDACHSRLYACQDWELAPYLSQPVLACHHLFASPTRHLMNSGTDSRWGPDRSQDDESAPLPFTGPRADYQANEAERQTRAQLQAMQSQLSMTLTRLFRSTEDVVTDFLPYLVRMVSPDVKPVVVGGSQSWTASVRKESERVMVKRAAEVLADVGIDLQKGKIESENAANRGPQFVYRMEPDLDALSTFETSTALLPSQAPVRYAVRQVLDQELQRTLLQRETQAREARFRAGDQQSRELSNRTKTAPLDGDDTAKSRLKLMAMAEDARHSTVVKRDFFGRVIETKSLDELAGSSQEKAARTAQGKVWVTYHEGLNNAVRKPMSLHEFLTGL